MAYRLNYHPDVKKVDLPVIDARNRAIIRKAIEERLAEHPEVFGKPLQRTLKGYWKFRVGDYRVVFKISGGVIIVLGIAHRKSIYRDIIKRT
jgi:mRNA interferase RelE/StbE